MTVNASQSAATASCSPEENLKSGWLLKYRPTNKPENRWSQLKGKRIYYYKSPDETVPRGFIELSDAKIDSCPVGVEFGFEVNILSYFALTIRFTPHHFQ